MTESTETARFYMRPGTEERSRRERWSAKGTARVIHPAWGTVVVPHLSNLAAIMNAAEVWRCDGLEIRGAEVRTAEPGDEAAKMPFPAVAAAGKTAQIKQKRG